MNVLLQYFIPVLTGAYIERVGHEVSTCGSCQPTSILLQTFWLYMLLIAGLSNVHVNIYYCVVLAIHIYVCCKNAEELCLSYYEK